MLTCTLPLVEVSRWHPNIKITANNLTMSKEIDYSESGNDDRASKEGKWVHGSKIAAILAVLVVGVMAMKYLKSHGPEADKQAPPRVIPVVEVVEVKAGPEQLTIETQGRIEPVRRTQAASEVMGRVVMVSPKFKAGGEFALDEIMLEIDSADYVAALASAKSSLADAKLLLAQEEARAEQALRDWEKLGRGKPSDLVIRKPQIESVKARIVASEAAVEKAVRDLDRTKLRAPYHCRVEATYTDLGSYIMTGARLADLYSADAFEARVPVTLEELGYLDQDKLMGAQVIAKAVLGGAERTWQGTVVRSEGMVDRQTMTMYLVVGIESNGEAGPYRLPSPGLFIQAGIQGKKMDRVTKIPRSTLRPDNTLLIMNADNELEIIPVKLARTLHHSILVSEGLRDGTKVIISPIETPIPGMKLALQEDARVSNEAP